MKSILVMSDTHGHKANMQKALKAFPGVDCIIHLGDYARDAEYIKTLTGNRVYSLRGNCDISSSARREILLRTGGVKILALHGHDQGVKSSLLGLGLYAAEKDADLVLFGHTHIPAEVPFLKAILFNPGSLGEPRGRMPSVGIVDIKNGNISITTHTVKGET